MVAKNFNRQDYVDLISKPDFDYNDIVEYEQRKRLTDQTDLFSMTKDAKIIEKDEFVIKYLITKQNKEYIIEAIPIEDSNTINKIFISRQLVKTELKRYFQEIVAYQLDVKCPDFDGEYCHYIMYRQFVSTSMKDFMIPSKNRKYLDEDQKQLRSLKLLKYIDRILEIMLKGYQLVNLVVPDLSVEHIRLIVDEPFFTDYENSHIVVDGFNYGVENEDTTITNDGNWKSGLMVLFNDLILRLCNYNALLLYSDKIDLKDMIVDYLRSSLRSLRNYKSFGYEPLDQDIRRISLVFSIINNKYNMGASLTKYSPDFSKTIYQMKVKESLSDNIEQDPQRYQYYAGDFFLNKEYDSVNFDFLLFVYEKLLSYETVKRKLSSAIKNPLFYTPDSWESREIISEDCFSTSIDEFTGFVNYYRQLATELKTEINTSSF